MIDYPLLPTIKIDNAFSQAELDYLKSTILEDPNSVHEDYIHDWEGPYHNKKMSSRCFFNFDELTPVSELIKSRLPKEVSENIIPFRTFILTSYLPYEIHCDSGWVDYSVDELPYYIIMISMSQVKSKTIILNQQGHYLHFVDYKKDNPKPLPTNERIPKEMFNEQFGHCRSEERNYISIKDTFEWNLGSVIAFDLRLFHLSNNFVDLGVTEKQGITLFTKTKKKNVKIT